MDASPPEGNGSVKAAISLYGEKIRGRKQDRFKTQIFPQEDLPSKTRELHQTRTNIGRLNETKSAAETEKARAESELSRANNAANELISRIEEYNARASARRSELKPVSKMERSSQEDVQYSEVVKELDEVKKELSRLKLDVASAMAAKERAEKEIEASSSKATTFSRSVEELKKKIDEADEEHVLVELARIEAEREFREIEGRRRMEADQFAKNIENAKKRIKELRRELNRSKELEMKLRITNSDVNVLQSEMELVREMERNYQTDLASKADKKKEEEDDSNTRTAVESAEAQLREAKEELALAKEESFQFMTSMDAIRQELIHISEETNRLKKLEKKAETNMQHLNSKLLKAKSALEAANIADKRSKVTVSNLSSALQQMQTEVEAAKKEEELITEETKDTRAETHKTNLEIAMAEQRLQAAARELETVKASEAMALKRLRNVTRRIMRSRAAAIPHSSTVTISKSEYEYLNQQASSAQEIAAKKVEAAQAWIEALAAEEKEILLKAESVEKEIKEFPTEEVMEIQETEKSAEEELDELIQNEDIAKPRKSTRENSITGSARKTKIRRLSTSSATRNTRSSSFTIKRKRIIPNLFKFLGDKKSRKQKAEVMQAK
ncbi:hypothetical protein Cni_G01699 [Canna indica]|uniref:Protein PLASTID MOVEMENT IMPAIRED 2 n=1 Tax=Canna indica TaxID=4628 RepID=A0AAQ3Q213_9LILI|nr:hypothetical protein Cni_G01699 [Canna indica]